MIMIEIIGLVAGFLTTGSQVPQAIKVHKTKNTDSLSILFLLALWAGTFGWLAYGYLNNDLALLLWNGFSVFTVGYLFQAKLKAVLRKVFV